MEIGRVHNHPIRMITLSVEVSIERSDSFPRTDNDICRTIHGEHSKGARKGPKNTTPANASRGTGTGTTPDGKSHSGKLGPLGETGYTYTHNNDTTRYRGKIGRTEMEMLGLVPSCKTKEVSENGGILASLDKAKN